MLMLVGYSAPGLYEQGAEIVHGAGERGLFTDIDSSHFK
jgi:hypothetical protein